MKGSDWIEFEKAVIGGQRLMQNDKTKIKGLYIIVAVNTGLRIGDLLNLKWGDLMGERLEITEQKTGKKVSKPINSYIREALKQFEGCNPNDPVFVSQKGCIYSRQAINRYLNNLWGISSHGLRKTFGRHIYEINGRCEDVLVKLSEIFNHSNLKVTRTYLGIRQKELDDLFVGM